MRVLYLVLNPKADEMFNKISAGELPSDRMYGIPELKKLGYDVNFKCIRPQGFFRDTIKLFNNYLSLNLTDIKSIRNIVNCDVVVVNGPFCSMVTLWCLLINKKLVYLDSIMRIPKNILRRIIYKFNILFSSGVVVYSNHQIQKCASDLRIPSNKFELIPFTIDVAFYKKITEKESVGTPFVLAVGRDLGRDYRTLIKAMDGLGVKLKLVTLPYLLHNIDVEKDWIEVLKDISYEDLCQLYKNSLFVVIPLKKWGTDYSSGIRGLLEAVALGKKVIATRSIPLIEYIDDVDLVTYVESENESGLRCNIINFLNNKNELMHSNTGVAVVEKKYDVNVFATAFARYLQRLCDGT
ncbi:glycosyltransferase family protein [Geomonas agri]|uniref:hypothetical protein n=1 Tax=Geomonas agri TaxID=2873702 RepID=UPI001CD525A3|nr:hypothetical protein [Geomonas agri]